MLDTILVNYDLTILSLGAMGLLLLVQILVADIVGIRAKHLPGSPIHADHGDLLFRASRTVANTNESIALYVVLILFCMLNGADATYTGYLSWHSSY